MLNSVILGQLADASDDNTQEEVSTEALYFHDANELLQKICDKEVSKYEINFLLESVCSSQTGTYFSTLLKKLIKTFCLNPLKVFVDYELTQERIDETVRLVRFLKCELPYIIEDEQLPFERKELIEFLNKYQAPHYLIFSLETMDVNDYGSCRSYLTSK